MPRIAPVTGKSDVPAEHHAVVDDVVKVFGGIRGPFSILLHSPKLAARLLPLVTFNREDNVVEPKLRSVAILSAVREREAAYVWAAQVGAARRAGVREEVIDLIRAKGDPARLSDEEREVVRVPLGDGQSVRGAGTSRGRQAARILTLPRTGGGKEGRGQGPL